MQNYIHDDSYIELLSVDDADKNIAYEEIDEEEDIKMIKAEKKSGFNSFLFGNNTS
jgi:hypothetical protein